VLLDAVKAVALIEAHRAPDIPEIAARTGHVGVETIFSQHLVDRIEAFLPQMGADQRAVLLYDAGVAIQ
jgi:hypothetical protein